MRLKVGLIERPTTERGDMRKGKQLKIREGGGGGHYVLEFIS